MAQKIKVNDVDYIWVDAAGTLPTPPSATGDFDVVYHNNSLATRQHENVKVTFTAADTSKVVTWASFGLRGFDVIDASGGGGFCQPFYVYFGVSGNGEIIGKQTLLDSQTFYFRSDMASIFTAHKASANTTGAEFLWYAGDGGAGAGGGGIHIVGGVPGAGAPTSGNGMELDSGPNADGQSIKDHGDQQCNLAADAALGGCNATAVIVGNQTTNPTNPFNAVGTTTSIVGGYRAANNSGGVAINSLGTNIQTTGREWLVTASGSNPSSITTTSPA